MSAEVQTSSIVIAAVSGGFGAALIGPIALALFFVTGDGELIGISMGSLSDFVMIGMLFGAIGLGVAVLAGLPAMLVLRRHSRLTLGALVSTGGAIGLAAGTSFLVVAGLNRSALVLGLVIGVGCGWIAWLVIQADVLRPNNSLERTREG